LLIKQVSDHRREQQSLDAAIDELEHAIVADHRRDPIGRLAARTHRVSNRDPTGERCDMF
jgi:hypothetical protein